MTNHPNLSAGHPARNPSPAEVRAAREAAGLTQTQAAALVHASARNWQQWEQEAGSNVRRMHPAIWELFRVKAQACRATKAKAQVRASHIKLLRRLLDDFQREERELCERFGNEVVPQSMRARKIKDAEALSAVIDLLA